MENESGFNEFKRLYGEMDNSRVSKFDRYLSKRYFVLGNNYSIELNKQSCKCIRLYDSEDEYDIPNAPNGSYYDESENVWCIDIDEEEFNAFDQTNEKYEYYKTIFAREMMRQLVYLHKEKKSINHLIGKHFY
jgi:hypothetical protein